MISGPKISIGITTYNRPEFLREAVESVLQQSFQDFELVISNDYLAVPVTWESLSIGSDSRITIINQATNLGEVKNMNFLLESARAEWFVWLADDDLLHPEFLMHANRAIKENHKDGLVGFFSNYVSSANPSGLFPKELGRFESRLYDSSDFLQDYSSRRIALVGTYGLMRTDLLRKIGGIIRLGNSFGPYSDNLVPIMLSKYGSLVWLDAPLVFLRTHPDSLSCKSTDLSAFTTAEDDFLKYLEQICAAHINFNSQLIIANMLKWFAQNELAVLSRDNSLKAARVLEVFLSYQMKHHLPRLSPKYKVGHIAYSLFLVGEEILRRLRVRLRATMTPT